MRTRQLLSLGLLLATATLPAWATRYWPSTPLTEWEMYVNNGVVYIQSPQFASHCSYSRGQVNVADSAYDRALYAYALSAKARGKALRYVVDDAATDCHIFGLYEL